MKKFRVYIYNRHFKVRYFMDIDAKTDTEARAIAMKKCRPPFDIEGVEELQMGV